jgi:hypothetical protein
MSRNPQFHNIAAEVFPKFEVYGSILDKYSLCAMSMIEEYMKSHSNKFAAGDIVFVGSTYQTRYYSDAFMLVGEEGKLFGRASDCAVGLPLLFNAYLPKNLSYKQMFDKFAKVIEMNADFDFTKDFNYEYDFALNFFGIPEGEKSELDDVYSDCESVGML